MDINTQLAKGWTASDRLSVIWKSDLTDKIKRSFSKQQSCRYCYMDALHGRELNVWRKHLMAITQECYEQYWTSAGGQQTPFTKTIQVRRTRHAKRCWRSKDEPISDILLWTSSYRRAKSGRPARTYLQQLCADIGYSLEDFPGAIDDRDGGQERVREVRTGSATWCWW